MITQCAQKGVLFCTYYYTTKSTSLVGLGEKVAASPKTKANLPLPPSPQSTLTAVRHNEDVFLHFRAMIQEQ